MKFSELRSMGHNVADSLGSGIGILIGFYEMDVYGEASRSPERFITVDFLNAKTTGGTPSPSLAAAIAHYKDALADLCAKRGTSLAVFKELKVRYSVDRTYGPSFVVTVEDRHGHRAVDEYRGIPGKRVKVLDHLGRLRPKRTQSH